MAEVVAKGLGFPEGPVLLPDGRMAFCEETASRISAFDGNGVKVVAETGGSPNGATLGSDGKLYVAQNGGVVGDWRAEDMIDPAIQRVGLDGTVETVATEVGGAKLIAPNDICFGRDGKLYFTDPSQPYDPENRYEDSRIYALETNGGAVAVRRPPVYTNGVGCMPDGRLVWVESYERDVYVLEAGQPRKIGQLPENHLPDGFAVAEDGRIFLATFISHGITIISGEGEYLGHIMLDEDALPSNCAFKGSELYVTDVSGYPEDNMAGRLWRIETDAVGMEMNAGTV